MSSDDDSPGDRERVRGRLQPLILAFYESRREAPKFHMSDLENYILAHGVVTAPGSPCRIMRWLRQHGELDYTVTKRSQSEYEFHYQDPPREAPPPEDGDQWRLI